MKNISFYERCYEVLRKVPKGKVTTYKDIAKALHSKAYRAVGTAMNKNPYSPQVPCHRVINSDGRVGNFTERLCGTNLNNKKRAGSGVSGQKSKIALLKREGVEIKDGKINLKKFGFGFV